MTVQDPEKHGAGQKKNSERRWVTILGFRQWLTECLGGIQLLALVFSIWKNEIDDEFFLNKKVTEKDSSGCFND